MCGIVGYYGNKEISSILLDGLQRLEYRGYDSAGISTMSTSGIYTQKNSGKVSDLAKNINTSKIQGKIGIGHTRWATHGEPNDINAHPHLDQSGKISIIHNGIIENYASIKKVLIDKGYEFKSDTDTEVLVQLISDIYFSDGLSFEQAVQAALNQVIGTYGIVTFCSEEPDKLVAARHGSPLVLGIGEDDYFIASDASPIVNYTRNVVYLDENEILTINNGSHEIRSISENKVVQKVVTEINFSIEEIEKGEFDHFMLKEIHDQVNTITDTMRGRINKDDGTAHLGGISDYMDRIQTAHRIYIVGCGTSWHAGLIGKYLYEEYAGKPVHVEYASEFRYRSPIIDAKTIVIAISQSGETADTLAAIKKAKKLGHFVGEFSESEFNEFSRSAERSPLKVGKKEAIAGLSIPGRFFHCIMAIAIKAPVLPADTAPDEVPFFTASKQSHIDVLRPLRITCECLSPAATCSEV